MGVSLTDRKQRVVLNGQISSWGNILAGVTQCSVYKNKKQSNPKLNDDVNLISKWAFQWKMFF